MVALNLTQEALSPYFAANICNLNMKTASASLVKEHAHNSAKI